MGVGVSASWWELSDRSAPAWVDLIGSILGDGPSYWYTVFDYPAMPYGDTQRYIQFVIDHLVDCDPSYFSVTCSKTIAATDGRPMVAVKISAKEHDTPMYEPIARFHINNEFYFLFRNKWWGVAVDAYGKRWWYHLPDVIPTWLLPKYDVHTWDYFAVLYPLSERSHDV